MIGIDREIRRNLDLLWLLTKKEITLKYKRTGLGILWSLVNPLLQALVLVIAFKVFMRVQMENYTFFLLSALFPWNWFSASVIVSTGTLIGNVNLIKKIGFPRHFLVIATILAQLVNFPFALPIPVGVAYLAGKGLGGSWLLGVPLLIVAQFAATTGVCLAIAMVNAYFRDMEYIIGTEGQQLAVPRASERCQHLGLFLPRHLDEAAIRHGGFSSIRGCVAMSDVS